MSNDTHPFIRRAALGACAAALAALVVPGATAHAATAHPAQPAVTPAKPGSGANVLTLPVPATRAGAAPQTISCTVTPSTPFRYYGGTYGGGEEGLANVSCTAPVYEIQLGVALFYNGSQVTYNSTTAYGTMSSGADTEYPLNQGTYQTGAQATITTVYGGTPVTSPVYGSATATLQ